MPLGVDWPWDFKTMVIIEIPTKIDAVMVFSKNATKKFSTHFDHSFEEHPPLFLEHFGYFGTSLYYKMNYITK
jgi:hypothetical protein